MHLGLIGYGSIAQALIPLLKARGITKITVLVRTKTREKLQPTVHFVTTLEALLQAAPDVVVECADHSAVEAYATDILENGTDLLVASVGSFADEALYDRVQASAALGKANLILPCGAIGGLDLLETLALSGSVQVTYCGTKPPNAWKGTPAEATVDLDSLTSRTVFFTGSGREAALKYPKNANVVAALALAGADFDDMNVELVADPMAVTNTHAYQVTSLYCQYEMQIGNAATSGNARTSMTTVLSILSDVVKTAQGDHKT